MRCSKRGGNTRPLSTRRTPRSSIFVYRKMLSKSSLWWSLLIAVTLLAFVIDAVPMETTGEIEDEDDEWFVGDGDEIEYQQEGGNYTPYPDTNLGVAKIINSVENVRKYTPQPNNAIKHSREMLDTVNANENFDIMVHATNFLSNENYLNLAIASKAHSAALRNDDMLAQRFLAVYKSNAYYEAYKLNAPFLDKLEPYFPSVADKKQLKDALSSQNHMFILACSRGDIAIADRLFEAGISYRSNFDQAFVKAASNGRIEILKKILEYEQIRPEYLDMQQWYDLKQKPYAQNEQEDVLNLENVPRDVVSLSGGDALIAAAGRDQLEVVKFLMEELGVSQTYHIFDAFKMSCGNPTTKVVQYLYDNDPNAVPQVDGFDLIQAAKHGNSATVALLLSWESNEHGAGDGVLSEVMVAFVAHLNARVDLFKKQYQESHSNSDFENDLDNIVETFTDIVCSILVAGDEWTAETLKSAIFVAEKSKTDKISSVVRMLQSSRRPTAF